MTRNAPCTFEPDQKAQQSAYFRDNLVDEIGFRNAAYRLTTGPWSNIARAYRDIAKANFDAEPKIELHTHANHALSSQMCCVNFLLPMADKPLLLERWVEHVLGIDGVTVEPIEHRAGQPWNLAFEWFPKPDYLNEGGATDNRKRGANATSLDAAIRYRHQGATKLVLIEWKYTEKYGSKLSGNHDTRDRRYHNLWQQPNGPMARTPGIELRDFYQDPLYQMLHQQMLAYRIENDRSAGIERATVLHISPAGNQALHRVTVPQFRDRGSDVFEVFSGLIDERYRDRFVWTTTDKAFGPLAGWPEADWWPYLRERYPGLCP